MEARMTHHQNHDPLGDLAAAGVAVWLDDLSRELLADGGLQSLIADRHVVGVTTNPTIFASALDQLAAAGVDFDDVTEYLERDGLSKFEKSWSELGATVAAELERQNPEHSRVSASSA
jgi:transaldolase